MTPIIQVKNLSHLYSGGTPFETTAIEDVSIDILDGQFIGLIGHTGSGKSTFVQHLNGLLQPTAGTVLYSGEDINRSAEARRDIRFKVGLVFQYPEHQLFEETVYKDIAFGPGNMKLPRKEIDERVRESAGFVGLTEDLFDKSPLELSGGEKRRVAIAGVIAMRPRVLVLDEPTASLDPAGRESVISNILDYQAGTGSTVIYVTHNMEEIAKISDRIVVFRDGRIAMDGRPGEVFARARELEEMGLSVPGAAKIAMGLRELGIRMPDTVYTLDQLKSAILDLREGAGAC